MKLTAYIAVALALIGEACLRDRLGTSDFRLSVLLDAMDSDVVVHRQAGTAASGVAHGGPRPT